MALGWDLGNVLATVSPSVRRRREADALERVAIEQVGAHRLAVMFGDPELAGPALDPAEPARTVAAAPIEMVASMEPAASVPAEPARTALAAPVPAAPAAPAASVPAASVPAASAARPVRRWVALAPRLAWAREAAAFTVFAGALVVAVVGLSSLPRWGLPPRGDGAVAGIVGAPASPSSGPGATVPGTLAPQPTGDASPGRESAAPTTSPPTLGGAPVVPAATPAPSPSPRATAGPATAATPTPTPPRPTAGPTPRPTPRPAATTKPKPAVAPTPRPRPTAAPTPVVLPPPTLTPTPVVDPTPAPAPTDPPTPAP